MKLQQVEPESDRHATVNDMRAILDEIANNGGGDFKITFYYRIYGETDDMTIRLSNLSLGENDITGEKEVQIK